MSSGPGTTNTVSIYRSFSLTLTLFITDLKLCWPSMKSRKQLYLFFATVTKKNFSYREKYLNKWNKDNRQLFSDYLGALMYVMLFKVTLSYLLNETSKYILNHILLAFQWGYKTNLHQGRLTARPYWVNNTVSIYIIIFTDIPLEPTEMLSYTLL